MLAAVFQKRLLNGHTKEASKYPRYHATGTRVLCYTPPLSHGVCRQTMALRVLIVDDSETTRRTLRLLLGSRDWTICGEADSGRSGVREFHQLKPDVVVLDLAMPDMDGIEAARLMALDNPKVPIILF